MRGTAQPGRWGEASHVLDARTRAFAREQLGEPVGMQPPSMRDVQPSQLTERQCGELFPGVTVGLTDTERARHARGMSYVDLLAWRDDAGPMSAPDAVIFPRMHEQAQAALEVCSREGIAVVPVGGGTSVTGGITVEDTAPRSAPRSRVVVVSTELLDEVYMVDEVSGIADVGAGVTGPQVEAAVASSGWTLGHFPQSWERASVGGFIAARSSGQASGGYGRIEDMLLSARLATPVGTWDVGGYPASSSGPDLRHVVLGSEGTLGVITSARLRLTRRPTIKEYAAVVIPGEFSHATGVLRELTRSSLRPTVLRASDSFETAALLSMSLPTGPVGWFFSRYLRARGATPGSLIVLGWEGTDRAQVAGARAFARERLQGAVWLGSRPGKSWERGRFHGPYLRDGLMDEGYLVETFETVTTWANLEALHASVRSAAVSALGPNSYVMAHISHTYSTGASLYFTVLAGGWSDPTTSSRRWQQAKAVITDAITSSGGAVSHHHGVGRDHRPWLPDQIGPIGMRVLRGIKAAVDPNGVMNPGALL